MELLKATGAYLQGHFKLTSGLHSPQYVQCALVLQYPEHAETLGRELAEKIRGRLPAELGVDLVASPAIGGIVLGHEVARALGTRAIFLERDSAGKMQLRRGFSVAPGEKAVVVEDVITTGGSTREVIEALKAAGADVLIAGCLVDRSGGKATLDVPYVSLLTLQIETYEPSACPLCLQGIPVVKPGSRPE